MFVVVHSCKKEDTLDCSTITGSTFSSSSGKMQAILANKCGLPNCHAIFGSGSDQWTYYAEYDSIQPHFNKIYEAVFVKKTMPQAGATPLNQAELDVFQCWKESGFPE